MLLLQPLDKCYIGSSPSADVKSVFRGQMGAVYLFTDALSWPVIQAMYHLGPGYKVLQHLVMLFHQNNPYAWQCVT
jgi:hypothetical protein